MSTSKALIATLLAVIVVALCAPADAASADVFRPKKEHSATVMSGYRAEILRLINRERTVRGLRPLRPQRCANRFAAGLASRLDRENSFHHADLRALARRCGFRMAAENIEIGTRSAKATVRGWMRSPGHRANILTPALRVSGIGLVYDNSRRRWIAVQDFGRR